MYATVSDRVLIQHLSGVVMLPGYDCNKRAFKKSYSKDKNDYFCVDALGIY